MEVQRVRTKKSISQMIFIALLPVYPRFGQKTPFNRIDSSNSSRRFFFFMHRFKTDARGIALSTHSTKLTQMATTCHLNLFTTIYCYYIVFSEHRSQSQFVVLYIQCVLVGFMYVCGSIRMAI